MEVKIVGTETRENPATSSKGWSISSFVPSMLAGSNSYTVYKISTHSYYESQHELHPFYYDKHVKTERRFSEFKKLVEYLKRQEKLEGVPLPKLDSTWKQAGSKEIEERQSRLEFVLNELLRRREILEQEAVRFFLLTDVPFDEFENISVYQRISSYLPKDFRFFNY